MVYQPQEDSYLLLKYVKKLAFGKVIDIGTGSGILAQGAADNDEVEEVVAVDIDQNAVGQLKNKKLGKIKILESDLFASITEKFDTIIFNPPYLPKEEKDADTALDGGAKGHELIEIFLKQAKKHLTDDGFILMVFSSRTGREKVDDIISKQGYGSALLEKKSLPFFEELFVYKIKKK